MHIQIEARVPNTISSYDTQGIVVNAIRHEKSLIISRTQVITPWPVLRLDELTEETMTPILALAPEIILIGHMEATAQIPHLIQASLSKHRIGIECMSLGAACRTFNVLLSEGRQIVAGFIL